MYSSSQGCHTATGTHMPHVITQCFLPPGRGDIPALTPAEAGTRLSDPGGMQGWVDLVDKRRSRVDRQSRLKSSIDRIDRANVKTSQSIISTWRGLLAVLQILLSTVNSDHRSNGRYVVVTNTDFDWQIASRAPPAVAELLAIRAAANE